MNGARSRSNASRTRFYSRSAVREASVLRSGMHFQKVQSSHPKIFSCHVRKARPKRHGHHHNDARSTRTPRYVSRQLLSRPGTLRPVSFLYVHRARRLPAPPAPRRDARGCRDHTSEFSRHFSPIRQSESFRALRARDAARRGRRRLVRGRSPRVVPRARRNATPHERLPSHSPRH